MNKKIILTILPALLMTTIVMANGNCLMSASVMENGGCPPCTTKLHVETVTVPSTTLTGASSSILTPETYIFEASGVWMNRNGAEAGDAEYYTKNNWASHTDGYNYPDYQLGPGFGDLQVDGSFVDWGTYNPTHEYSIEYTGTGNTVNFRIFDGDSNIPTLYPEWYGDNSRNLEVDIYKCEDPCLRDSDGDRLNDCLDICPGTVNDTMNLGTNRWMWVWNAGGLWTTKLPKGKGPQKQFSIIDTHGCSCTQILDRLHANYPAQFGNMEGHYKFGCSISIMEEFLELSVNE